MRTEIDRQWCRALAEEIGDRPDLIERVTANYNRQRDSCTGLAATWCPIHGDCTCPRRDDGEVEFSGLGGCPLHDVNSQHGEDA